MARDAMNRYMRGLIDSLYITIEGDPVRIADHEAKMRKWSAEADEEQVLHLAESINQIKVTTEDDQ